jgi:hypothetical protein
LNGCDVVIFTSHELKLARDVFHIKDEWELLVEEVCRYFAAEEGHTQLGLSAELGAVVVAYCRRKLLEDLIVGRGDVVGGGGAGQAYGMAAGSEPLVTLGDYADNEKSPIWVITGKQCDNKNQIRTKNDDRTSKTGLYRYIFGA